MTRNTESFENMHVRSPPPWLHGKIFWELSSRWGQRSQYSTDNCGWSGRSKIAQRIEVHSKTLDKNCISFHKSTFPLWKWCLVCILRTRGSCSSKCCCPRAIWGCRDRVFDKCFARCSYCVLYQIVHYAPTAPFQIKGATDCATATPTNRWIFSYICCSPTGGSPDFSAHSYAAGQVEECNWQSSILWTKCCCPRHESNAEAECS